MIRLLAKAVSLPLEWLGKLMLMLRMLPLAEKLLKGAWSVSGDGETARLALAAILSNEGLEAARAQAATWFEARPRPQVAAFAGIFAAEAGESDLAREYLARGLRAGHDPTAVLELLEMAIAVRSDRPEESGEVAGRLLARRDLSPTVSRLALSELTWVDMLAGRFDQARRQADRLLAVDEDPSARIAMWALALRAGRNGEAARHLARTRTMPVGARLYLQCLGYAAIGQHDRARAALDELRGADPEKARQLESVVAATEAKPCGY